MMKKFFSIVLSLCMVLTMMPMATGVAWAATASTVSIGTATLDSTNKYYHNGLEGAQGVANATPDGANATFDSQNGTLTLNGLVLSNTSGYSIAAAGDLQIVLQESSINNLGDPSNATNIIYVFSASGASYNLTISGPGTLTAVNGSSAYTTIFASGNITINGGAQVTATHAGGDAQAINAYNGSIEISETGTTVNAKHSEVEPTSPDAFALKAYSSIRVSNGATLTATSGKQAVSGSVSIDTATSSVKVGESSTSCLDWDEVTSLDTYKYLKIEPKAPVATALEGRTFGFAYDVQRSVSYPAKDETIHLSDLAGPIIDSNRNHGTSAGSWTLTKAGTYSYMKSSGKATTNLKYIVEGVAGQYSSLNPDTIVIHELKNGDEHFSYGVVVAYNATAGYALFQGDILGGSGAGYFLSTSERSGEFDVTASAIATDFVQDISISLEHEGETFPFTSQTPEEVTITNTGNVATGDLTVSLSGDDAARFTLEKNSNRGSTISISSIATDGYDTFTIAPNTGLTAGTYTAKVTVSGQNIVSKSFDVSFKVEADKAPSNPGSYVPTIQHPTIIADEGAETTLSFYGDKLTIKMADDYELTDVILNGVSKGKVTELSGLKTGDTVEVKTEKKQEEPKEPTKEEIIAALKEQQLVARSKLTTAKSGKKAILITWYDKNGNEVAFDGVEIFRSTKRNSGYGNKPIFVSKTGKYYNTAVTEGTRYYYKVRGYVIIDGQKYYTEYSLKAIRTFK